MRKKIALLVGQPEEYFQNSFIKGFLEQAFPCDLDVCIFAMYQKHQSTKVREKGEAGIFSLVRCDLFDGIVVLAQSIMTTGVLDRIDEELHEHYDKPVVFIDRESKYFPAIMTENYTPIKSVISHLIEVHGCTDIAFLTGHPKHPHAQDRLRGFIDCMNEHGLTVPENRIFYGDFWYNSGASTARQLLQDRDNLPQAIACANDYMALGLIGELNKAGINVPEDIAVTGYDNTEDGRLFSVPLTSISLPAYECGECAGKWIIALMNGGELEEFSALGGINIGRSCGCVQEAGGKEQEKYDPRAKRSRTEYFDFNVSTMEDDLLMQSDLSGVINTIFYYVNQIRPFEGFHLCLNSGWLNDGVYENSGGMPYSDTMIDVLRCGRPGKGADRVDLGAVFERRELLPELFEKSDRPRAFYFTPLFFDENIFGYAAINYGANIKCYDAEYKRWLGKVMHGLECFRRNAYIELAKKAVADERDSAKPSGDADGDKAALVADILDNNLLTYFFQPIVSAYTGDILAYEALMRSNTEEFVSPLEILKCAEQAGRLSDVERATFINVLSYFEEHSDLFENKKVFINSIPGAEVTGKDADIIREKLQKLSGRVVVELTEQAELDDENLAAIKKRYEKLGIETAVDDYGTGYSNVYNLLRYMPDYVKIDRALMSNIHINSQKQHFVKEIIEFCHNNQIAVLAEGVETTEELKTVIVLGVDLIQGYYTARPGADVVSAIDGGIKTEIIQYGQYAVEKSQSEIYFAGQEDTISLIKLVPAHYSKIVFRQDVSPHRDVSIVGLQGFAAEIDIEIEDGFTGRIELTDVDIAVHNEHPSILIGENCDVTLVLIGENVFEEGGILVPESSKLTVQGEGNLFIKKIAINGYGIGNDNDSRHGELLFDQDGLIKIQGNLVCGVGIGAGYGGKIRIRRGLYSLQLGGQTAVGIGSLYEDVDISIQNCGLEYSIKSAVAVGLGSLKGSVRLAIEHIGYTAFYSSQTCVCIGTLEGERFELDLSQATLEINAHANHMSGIGALAGKPVLRMNNFYLSMTVSGNEAIAMGDPGKKAEIDLFEADIIVNVKNTLDFDIGAASYGHVNGISQFTYNDKKVHREVKHSDSKPIE